MKEGAALIRYFSCPTRKKDGTIIRHLPSDAPERWETFKAYNIRDVEVEQAVLAKVRRLEPADSDENLYTVDQLINDRGVMIDRQLVDNAARFDDEYKAQLLEEAKQLTGMENPNSPAQIKEYLRKVTGSSFASLNKKSLDDIEAQLKFWPKAKRVLSIRRELGKTSNKSITLCSNAYAQTDEYTGFCNFAAPPGLAAGPAVWCRYRIYRKII